MSHPEPHPDTELLDKLEQALSRCHLSYVKPILLAKPGGWVVAYKVEFTDVARQFTTDASGGGTSLRDALRNMIETVYTERAVKRLTRTSP